MSLTRTLAATALFAWATAAMADGVPSVAYQDFAAKYPHIPLATCPAIVEAPHADCHLAVIDRKLHVLAFATSGDFRLLAVYSEAGGQTAAFRLSRLD